MAIVVIAGIARGIGKTAIADVGMPEQASPSQ
jgi:hypothetical protein